MLSFTEVIPHTHARSTAMSGAGFAVKRPLPGGVESFEDGNPAATQAV